MPIKRLILFILALFLIGLFLWSIANIHKEYEISRFSSSLEGRSEAQLQNLRLAAQKLDGVILNPSETFSFNKIVGERLRSAGYMGAPTIYQGQTVNTAGGGMCQMSSTVYNAALLAGMEIIRRTPHLWVVESVGPGRDAAILYGKNESIDLQFRNKFTFPVKLKVEVTESRLFARILAPKKLQNEINIETEILQVYHANHAKFTPPKSMKNSPPSRGKKGYKIKVYRIFSSQGKVIKKEIISTDKYEPVP